MASEAVEASLQRADKKKKSVTRSVKISDPKADAHIISDDRGAPVARVLQTFLLGGSSTTSVSREFVRSVGSNIVHRSKGDVWQYVGFIKENFDEILDGAAELILFAEASKSPRVNKAGETVQEALFSLDSLEASRTLPRRGGRTLEGALLLCITLGLADKFICSQAVKLVSAVEGDTGVVQMLESMRQDPNPKVQADALRVQTASKVPERNADRTSRPCGQEPDSGPHSSAGVSTTSGERRVDRSSTSTIVNGVLKSKPKSSVKPRGSADVGGGGKDTVESISPVDKVLGELQTTDIRRTRVDLSAIPATVSAVDVRRLGRAIASRDHVKELTLPTLRPTRLRALMNEFQPGQLEKVEVVNKSERMFHEGTEVQYAFECLGKVVSTSIALFLYDEVYRIDDVVQGLAKGIALVAMQPTLLLTIPFTSITDKDISRAKLLLETNIITDLWMEGAVLDVHGYDALSLILCMSSLRNLYICDAILHPVTDRKVTNEVLSAFRQSSLCTLSLGDLSGGPSEKAGNAFWVELFLIFAVECSVQQLWLSFLSGCRTWGIDMQRILVRFLPKMKNLRWLTCDPYPETAPALRQALQGMHHVRHRDALPGTPIAKYGSLHDDDDSKAPKGKRKRSRTTTASSRPTTTPPSITHVGA